MGIRFKRKRLSVGRLILVGVGLWLVIVTGAHFHFQQSGKMGSALRVGYLPITCHLLVPVSWHDLQGTEMAFEAVKFSAWPEMIEALRGGELDVTFILAPIALALIEQGVPIKIVMLGHRDGTALVAVKRPDVNGLRALKGKPLGIPIRFSMQNLALRMLWKRQGLPWGELDTVEIPPPDMPSALAAGGIQGYIVGEPYAAQAELEGTGRVLYQMKDVWPGFISSVVVVSQEAMEKKGDRIVALLKEFQRQSLWIEGHREEAAAIGAQVYGLSEELIKYVLTTPPDRVSYKDLLPRPAEFDQIGRLMIEAGLVKSVPSGEEALDLSWALGDTGKRGEER